jgi:signal transduction histidine kinase
LTVHDTGIGITSDMLPRLFDIFAQADRSLERSRGGLGLGLTLVKGLIGLHGGTVTATSGGAGTGSTFTVRLPLMPPSA